MSAADSTAAAGEHDASGEAGASSGSPDGSCRKRASPELDGRCASKQQNCGGSAGGAAAAGGCSGDDLGLDNYPASRRLLPVQRAIIGRVVRLLDPSHDSVVITNPLEKNAIIYVTEAWQAMCGYCAREAVGQNPRLTQGKGTDISTVRAMEHAVRCQQSCKVRVVNYRGHSGEAFWNCLTMHPVLYRNQTVLFMARLQDYSHRLNKMMSFVPAQFCKASDQLQCIVDLTDLQNASGLSQPCRIKTLEVDGVPVGEGGEGSGGEASSGEGSSSEGSIDGGSTAGGAVAAVERVPTRHVKRLGFTGLALEPEYLADRLREECANLEWPCQATEMVSSGAEVIRLEMIQKSQAGGELDQLHAFLHIMPENTNGKYLISFTRLSGDTFQFHSVFRELRRRLGDLQFVPLCDRTQKC